MVHDFGFSQQFCSLLVHNAVMCLVVSVTNETEQSVISGNLGVGTCKL